MPENDLLDLKGESDRSHTQVTMEELELVSEDRSLFIECECGCSFGTLSDFESHMGTHFNSDWSPSHMLRKASIDDRHKSVRD